MSCSNRSGLLWPALQGLLGRKHLEHVLQRAELLPSGVALQDSYFTVINCSIYCSNKMHACVIKTGWQCIFPKPQLPLARAHLMDHGCGLVLCESRVQLRCVMPTPPFRLQELNAQLHHFSTGHLRINNFRLPRHLQKQAICGYC